MVTWRLDAAARAMRGTLEGGAGAAAPASAGERPFTGASLDSRRLAGGELFFALPGERTDGHRFVPAALAAGAAAAVVSRPQPEVGPDGVLIRVADPYRALHDLARAVRARVPEHLVGLTGSVGKTTTKELLAAMLARRYRVAKSPGNFNNLLGFPVALLGIPEDTEWMVAEMGMSTPGELGELSRLARPDVAMLLNVRPAHLENFRSLSEVAEAKAEILAGLAPEGLLIANSDDPEVVRVARRHPGRIVWFGHGPGADVLATGVEELAAGLAPVSTRFTLAAFGRRHTVELALHGRYNVDNALAAAACALALGVEMEAVAEAARSVLPAGRRGVVHRLRHGATLIDDSYNSSPGALTRALESAAALATGRAWVVLGDMLELGPQGPRFHREAGRQVAEMGFAPVLGVGELARDLVGSARAVGTPAEWFATAEEAASRAAAEVRPGDLVLVKGSRAVELERVVDSLLAAWGEEGDADSVATSAAGGEVA